MRTVRRALLVVCMVVASTVLAAPAGAASGSTAGYALAGTATITPGSPLGCSDGCASLATATGTAACGVCLPGRPAGGAFALDLPTATTFPPSPCRIKTIAGTLAVIWDSGRTSTAAVSGHFVDSKPIVTLSGSFGAADPVYPSAPAKLVLNGFPPSPCRSATSPVSGMMSIAPG